MFDRNGKDFSKLTASQGDVNIRRAINMANRIIKNENDEVRLVELQEQKKQLNKDKKIANGKKFSIPDPSVRPGRGRPPKSYNIELREKDINTAIKQTRKDIEEFKANLPTYQPSAEDTAGLIQHCINVARLPRIDMSDPDQVEERALLYFQICQHDNVRPTMPGLSSAFGVNIRVMTEWRSSHKFGPQVAAILDQYAAVINSELETLMMYGKINPVTGIFLSKNHFGYSDRQDLTISPPKEETDISAILDKADALPD